MATRAHSTPVPAARRRLPATPAVALPNGRAPKPRRVRKPAAKSPAPPAQKAADCGNNAFLPGLASLTYVMADLWEACSRHQDAQIAARKAGDDAGYERESMSEASASAQAFALESLIVAGAPQTPADAVAHLLVCHAEIYSLSINVWNEASERKAVAVLEHALRSLALLARTSSFDIARVASHYMTAAQARMVCGEVPA